MNWLKRQWLDSSTRAFWKEYWHWYEHHEDEDYDAYADLVDKLTRLYNRLFPLYTCCQGCGCVHPPERFRFCATCNAGG